MPTSPQKRQRVPVSAAGRAGACPLPAVGCPGWCRRSAGRKEFPLKKKCKKVPLFAVKKAPRCCRRGRSANPSPTLAGSCSGWCSGGCCLPRPCQNPGTGCPRLRAPRRGVRAFGQRDGEARWHRKVPGVKATTVPTETHARAGGGGPGGEAGLNPQPSPRGSAVLSRG